MRRACLNVCTKRLASPFVAGWYGADLMCLIPLLLMKARNSVAMNCGPLSLTSCSGKPCAVKSFLSSSMVLVVFVEAIGITSGHLECTSTTIKNIVPKNGPVKSTWMRCQGCAGHSHEGSGAILGLFWVSWQPVHPFDTCSIALSIPGHHT